MSVAGRDAPAVLPHLPQPGSALAVPVAAWAADRRWPA
jgi:hypothetical protein